jgi:HlyD family secretion protein
MAHDADLRLNQETQIPEPDPAVTPAAPATTAPGRFKLRPPSRRWLYWAVGLGVVGLAVWALRPGPKRVDLITVEPGPLAVTVDAEGRTRVRDRFVVAAPVDGRLSRMGLEVGDPVTANQVVARLDPLPLTTEVQQAQARLAELRAQTRGVDTLRPKTDALEQAQNRIAAAQADQSRAEAELARAAASWQQAQRELERANELAAQGAISAQAQESAALAATSQEQAWKAAQQQVDSAIAAVNAAQNDRQILQAEQQDPDYLLDVYQAEIASTEATLARLADAARRTTITAPSAGQVLRILEESARYVTAGTPLLEVGDPEQLEIVIDVLSSDAVKIQPGDRIHINQWGGDETLLAAGQLSGARRLYQGLSPGGGRAAGERHCHLHQRRRAPRGWLPGGYPNCGGRKSRGPDCAHQCPLPLRRWHLWHLRLSGGAPPGPDHPGGRGSAQHL